MDLIKQQIKDTKQDIETLEKQSEKLAIVKEEVFDMKVDILGAAFGMLMKKIHESIDDWLKINSEKQEQDITLGDKIKEVVGQAIAALAQQKPPEVNVIVSPPDLAPLKSALSEMSKQGETMIKLMNKMAGGDGKLDELQKLVVIMVGRQNTFLERIFKETDYTPLLQKVAEGVNKSAIAYEGKITKRTDDRLIDEFYIKPANNK